jgi:hypothetical protein
MSIVLSDDDSASLGQLCPLHHLPNVSKDLLVLKFTISHSLSIRTGKYDSEARDRDRILSCGYDGTRLFQAVTFDYTLGHRDGNDSSLSNSNGDQHGLPIWNADLQAGISLGYPN